MSKQQKLNKYFTISTQYSSSIKKCFIYDPEKFTAFFDYQPAENDIYLNSKCNNKIKLFYRPPSEEFLNSFQNELIKPNVSNSYSIPLLKSNLQKAIRRGDNIVAIETTIILLNLNCVEFFRRLAIIFIEDVCLFDSFPIIIWLMITEDDYKINNLDFYIIINIIINLCDCNEYYDQSHESFNDFTKFNHEKLQHSNCLLSLYYRYLYGGMSGDMNMLLNAIHYYDQNINEIKITNYENIAKINEKNKMLSNEVRIITASIDFHCFPQMLVILSKLTRLNKDVIRKNIWDVLSCINYRKLFTIENSERKKRTYEWQLIEQHIEDVRILCMNDENF